MFTVCLPDGHGGPQGVYVKVEVREWIKHVTALDVLPFQYRYRSFFMQIHYREGTA